MTMVQDATGAARRASRNPWLRATTRVGFIGYGLMHLLVAWLAVQIASSGSRAESDQSGAFATLARQPFGRFLLAATAVGLAAMALWQLLAAAVGHRSERGRARVFERVLSLCRTAFYAVLAYTAAAVLRGGASSAGQQQRATAAALSMPGGPVIVTIVGLIVVGAGLGMVWYGIARKFRRRLRISEMSRTERTVALALGQFGYAARGAAFAIVGVLLVVAAATYNPGRSRGLDAALRTLAGQPFGDLLLMLVAAGFAAFGIYCFFQARYRKV